MRMIFAKAFAFGLFLLGATVVVSQPAINVTPDSLAEHLMVGNTAVRTVTISNSGTANLQFNVWFQGHPSAPVASGIGGQLENRPLATTPQLDHRSAYSQVKALGSGAESYQRDVLGSVGNSASIAGTLNSAKLDSFVVFSDDMENGLNGWTHASLHSNGIDQWAQSGSRYRSGAGSWHVSQHDYEGDDALKSPPIDLTQFKAATLSFYHWYSFDDCSETTFEPDGGIVEVSTDGGSSWIQISPVGGYPYVLDDECSNPLAYHEAYSHHGGVGDGFVPALFDLTPYAGKIVTIRFRAGWDCGNCASNEGWFVDDVSVYSTDYASWLAATPDSGTVAPGSSTDIAVTFDAANLFGGQYLADMVVTSNDPVAPELRVPTVLSVTGVPRIAVSPSAADLGALFIGLSVTDTLTVSNTGTDNLAVSSITCDNPEFTVAGSGLTIPPTESRKIVVTFTPGAAGARTGTLTLASNDPLNPSYLVSVQGEGIVPPHINITPDSLDADLLTGAKVDRNLTIENLGGSDLTWRLEISWVDALSTSSFLLTIPSNQSGSAVVDQIGGSRYGSKPPVRTSAIQANLLDLTGVNILFDASHGNNGISYWATIVGDLQSRGAAVTVNTGTITSTTLQHVDIFWLVDFWSSTLSTSEIAVLHDWLLGGGGLLIEGDESLSSYNALLSSVGAGIIFTAQSPVTGVTTAIFPHETTAGITRLYIDYPLARLTTVNSPAGVLVQDLSGGNNVAYSQVGSGRIIAMADENFGEYTIGSYDNQLFGNQVFDWLARTADFASVDRDSGTVASGSSTTIAVTFDATGLNGGDYLADLNFTTSDPVRPNVRVPAHLHVTGAPDIALSPDSVSFGSLFVGRSKSDTVVIRNAGTDLLHVTNIASSIADYIPAIVSSNLNPGAQIRVPVTFTPTTAGLRRGILTVISDDPDMPSATVVLRGTGLIPPSIAVSPDSLDEALLSNQTSTRQLTVTNSGGSDLVLDVTAQFISGFRSLSSSSSESSLLSRLVANHDANPNAQGSEVRQSDERQPASTALAPLAGTYTGDYLQFGLTDYGEILPFQFPVGNEHLQWGTYLSGYTIAYRVAGVDQIAIASYNSRSRIVPVSYKVVMNTPSMVVVEVMTKTSDDLITLTQTFTFDRHDKFVNIQTRIANVSGAAVTDIVFKSYADWDTDGTYYDNWNYDLSRNMIYAWNTNYTAIASSRVPDLMDLDGWSDYNQRTTTVNYPTGPLTGFDGLEILHFALGTLGSGSTTMVETVYGAGNSFSDLQAAIDRGMKYVAWLTINPITATIPAGSSQVFNVKFDATGLFGGDYLADLAFRSNDSANPEVDVPAHLHVTGVPTIGTDPDSLIFGTCFVGASLRDTIVVSNLGTDLLTVTNISAGTPDFTAHPTNFNLAPGGTMPVEVVFAPGTAGSPSTILSIASNDPLNPVLSLLLRGQALLPPEIHVTPGSITANLVLTVNPTQKDTLVVSNTGHSNLVWTAQVRSVSVRDSLRFNLAVPPPPPTTGLIDQNPNAQQGISALLRTSSVPATLLDLTGVKILFDQYHGSNSMVTWSTLIGDLQSRGATVVANSSPFTVSLLQDVDILWMIDFSGPSLTSSEMTVFHDWLIAGGSLLIEGDQSLDDYNALLSSVGAGITYSWGSPAPGVTTLIYPHATTTDVDSLYIDNPLATLSPVSAPAAVLVKDIWGYVDVAYSTVGHGRIIAMANENLSDYAIGAVDNQLFGNQVIDWLASPSTWMTFAPSSGTTPVGSSNSVVVSINGSSLATGDYSAILDFVSNDPATPVVGVPVTIHVKEYICGDVNADGVVNSADINYIMRTYFYYGPAPRPLQAGDANCDGWINLSDICLLAKFVNGTGTINCCLKK